MEAKKVFEALPHVNEIWVTEDGNFHLDSHSGGEKFVRGMAQAPAKEVAEPAKESEEIQAPAKEVAPVKGGNDSTKK